MQVQKEKFLCVVIPYIKVYEIQIFFIVFLKGIVLMFSLK